MERQIHSGLLALLGLLASSTASALPMLQIDVLGGSYDPVSEDVYGSESLFTLNAYGKVGAVDTSAHHYLSAAITPMAGTGADIGSFSVDGTTYDSSDMRYGTPPIENFEAIQGHDSNDLGKHGIFDTLFLELVFKWDATQTRNGVNVEDNPGTDPLTNAGNALFWNSWAFDASGLADGVGLHFDLYTVSLKNCGNSLKRDFGGTLPSSCVDIDVDDKAPFSHDATFRPGDDPDHPLPEPSMWLVLMAGLMGLWIAGRGRQKPAAAKTD